MITKKQIEDLDLAICPFGCGVAGELYFKTYNSGYDVSGRCPKCGSSGPTFYSVSIGDSVTNEIGYDEGAERAIEGWNKRG